MRQLRLCMAQINTTVGDFEGNLAKILKAIDEARSFGTDLVTFPELAVCGYPPEDLLFKSQFLERNLKCINEVVGNSHDIVVMVGFVDQRDDIYNAAAIIHDGRLVDVYHKILLPNYGVFDEDRYFKAGTRCPIYTIAGVKTGVTICEDMWYESGPGTVQAHHGAEILVNISASPYHFRKGDFRKRMLGTRAADNVAIVAHTNLVGGQDELVFDGSSMVLDEKGRLVARARSFQEDLLIVDLNVDSVLGARLRDPRRRKGPPPVEGLWTVHNILVSGARSAVARPP
ncbi:MAG: NAD+ synthase, partial [Dehalococcoidia bacterium]|nr:NAD+ synthase [Dehalococcoidia bacterium]